LAIREDTTQGWQGHPGHGNRHEVELTIKNVARGLHGIGKHIHRDPIEPFHTQQAVAVTKLPARLHSTAQHSTAQHQNTR